MLKKDYLNVFSPECMLYIFRVKKINLKNTIPGAGLVQVHPYEPSLEMLWQTTRKWCR